MPGLCKDCRNGNVVFRSDFYGFWEEHFTQEEIQLMSEAIWG